jgi:hypothetical protein
MALVRIEDPPGMNVLGLVLAASLERGFAACGGAPNLRGALEIVADGMRATIVFSPDGAVVTRAATPAKAEVRAPLHLLVEAMVRPRLLTLLRVKVRGNRLLALRAMRYLRP